MIKQFFSLFFILAICVTCAHTVEEIGTKEELGRQLFFDKNLSKNKKISCASCHMPAYGFADTLAFSIGLNGKQTNRNAPSVLNMGARSAFFYDGRVTSLEDQIMVPIEHPEEMGFTSKALIKRLKGINKYKQNFEKIYQEPIDQKNIADAIASYIRQLETSVTPFDQWMRGEPSTMSESAKRGRDLFMGQKAKCFNCHFSPDFTTDQFRNIGLYDERQFTDKGRYEVTKNKEDLGKFKVSGLRNVAVTAPYMHNGMFATLAEVVEYYNNPRHFVSKPINIDPDLQKPLNLTEEEKYDLVSFLISLTDVSFEVKKDHYRKFGS
jgi:cytochrome c peroxidase